MGSISATLTVLSVELILPRLHAHQINDDFLLNRGVFEQEGSGAEPTVYEGVQG